jgi:hypothetical protein
MAHGCDICLGGLALISPSYEDILHNLDSMLRFCGSIGLGNIAEQSRFAYYRRRIAYLLEVIRVRPIPRELEEHQDEYRTYLTESIEFGQLLPYLQQCDPACVLPKIKVCLGGPALPGDESATSNVARNLQFELHLASTLWQAGFQPILGEHPDLKCKVEGKWLFFECKRILSKAKLTTRIREASKQLRKSLSTATPPHGARGMIAISLSIVLNPTQRALLIREHRDGLEILANGLESQEKNVQDELGRLSYQKIPAILFHAASSFENFDPSHYTFGQYFFCRCSAGIGSPDYKVVMKFADAMAALAAQYGPPRASGG